MAKSTRYVAKIPGKDGTIHYTEQENATWQTLYERQTAIIGDCACDEYLDALQRIELPRDRVPQCREISKILLDHTGWQVVPVPALINFGEFFRLLADKKFPAASFIRHPDELDYLREPDIFHEIFGHTPLLTDKRFAAFTHAYGKAGLNASKQDRVMLARLYWFTVEFGLIQRPAGLKVYGAGIVSSIGETPYALSSDEPQRHKFDPVQVLRTPYRIDEFQRNYFILDSFDELFELANTDLMGLIAKARRLGMAQPHLTSLAS